MTEVLKVGPHVIAMQEVVSEMYDVIVRRLRAEDPPWVEIRRWREREFTTDGHYFNVTAVKEPQADDGCENTT